MSEGVFNSQTEIGEINKTLEGMMQVLVLMQKRLDEHKRRLDQIDLKTNTLAKYGVKS